MSIIDASQLQHGFFVPANPATTESNCFSWLAQFGLLRVQGPDSERFLQGQLTCDVVSMDQNQWTTGACCTAKGRMVANFIIVRDEQGYWLRLPLAQVDALTQHLKKYAVFFKAELHNLTQSHAVIGQLPAAEVNADGIIDTSAIIAGRVAKQTDNGFELHYQDGRREYWLAHDQAEALLEQQPLCRSDNWSQHDIVNGTIWVDEISREHWIPQNIDWHQQGGVSFSKGCYTGQEIVARLQYLGKSKKALFLLCSQNGTAASAEILSSVTDDQGKTIGELASWNGLLGLGLLNADCDMAELRLNDGENSVTLKKLSYTDEQGLSPDA